MKTYYAETFDEWWERRGRMIDPEPSVSWEDKRKALAEEAYRSAMAQSGNVVVDVSEEPRRAHFANGRRVEVAADGCLSIGWQEREVQYAPPTMQWPPRDR